MPHPQVETLDNTTRAALSVSKAAGFVGVDPRTLSRSLDDGDIPSIRVGRRRLVPTQALRQFLAGNPDHGGAA